MQFLLLCGNYTVLVIQYLLLCGTMHLLEQSVYLQYEEP